MRRREGDLLGGEEGGGRTRVDFASIPVDSGHVVGENGEEIFDVAFCCEFLATKEIGLVAGVGGNEIKKNKEKKKKKKKIQKKKIK